MSRDPAQGAVRDRSRHYDYIPLRRKDIEALRRFRNAQVDVLRQAEPISSAQQEHWDDSVVVASSTGGTDRR